MSFEAWALPPGSPPISRDFVSIQGRNLPPLLVPESGPGDIESLSASLRAARAEGLVSLPVTRVIQAVDRVARRFLDPGDELRATLLEVLGPWSGFSEPMARAVLDGMAVDWTRPRLEALLRSEFPDPGVLDEFRPDQRGGEVRATGFPLTFHMGAGTVPGVGATSLIRALLVKSAVLLKPGRGDLVLPVFLARGLMEVDPGVGSGVAVLYWPSEDQETTRAALDGADLVVVYGGDETVAWVRDRIPLTKPLRAYRHRMGVGLVGKDALDSLDESSGSLAMAVARAVSLFDQRGCVSPHSILVEEGGGVEPGTFGEMLAQALERMEAELPSGPVTGEGGSALQQVRGEAEVAESSGDGFVRHGGSRAPWTVLFQPGRRVGPTCLNRTVRVIPVSTLQGGVDLLGEWAPHLQTVAVAGLGREEGRVLDALVELGVSRISSFEGTPWPPPWWHHDGDGPVRSLVRWTDRER